MFRILVRKSAAKIPQESKGGGVQQVRNLYFRKRR
jgi:hypothetical protein